MGLGKRRRRTTAALPQKVRHMKRSDAFPSRFLKASDVNGEDLAVTISGIDWEEVGKDRTRKPVLYFRGKVKPLILNGTNWDAIVRITGEDDSEQWEGEKIALYSTRVQFGREMVDAIRIRESRSVKNGKADTMPVSDMPNDDIPF
jgi:hypothetical protein